MNDTITPLALGQEVTAVIDDRSTLHPGGPLEFKVTRHGTGIELSAVLPNGETIGSCLLDYFGNELRAIIDDPKSDESLVSVRLAPDVVRLRNQMDHPDLSSMPDPDLTYMSPTLRGSYALRYANPPSPVTPEAIPIPTGLPGFRYRGLNSFDFSMPDPFRNNRNLDFRVECTPSAVVVRAHDADRSTMGLVAIQYAHNVLTSAVCSWSGSDFETIQHVLSRNVDRDRNSETRGEYPASRLGAVPDGPAAIRRVVVQCSGGSISSVGTLPRGVELEMRDYDDGVGINIDEMRPDGSVPGMTGYFRVDDRGDIYRYYVESNPTHEPPAGTAGPVQNTVQVSSVRDIANQLQQNVLVVVGQGLDAVRQPIVRIATFGQSADDKEVASDWGSRIMELIRTDAHRTRTELDYRHRHVGEQQLEIDRLRDALRLIYRDLDSDDCQIGADFSLTPAECRVIFDAMAPKHPADLSHVTLP